MPPKVIPKRYFPGRPIVNDQKSDSGSDSGSSDSEDEQIVQKHKVVSENKAYVVVNQTNNKSAETSGSQREQNTQRQNRIPLKSESEDDDKSDEESENSGESDSSDESRSLSSSEEESFTKLVFVSKSDRKPKNTSAIQRSTLVDSSKERALNYIEHQIRTEAEAKKLIKASYEEDLGGIDDTDDLNPEYERQQWEIRELQRMKREKDSLKEKQQEFEERENARLENLGNDRNKI